MHSNTVSRFITFTALIAPALATAGVSFGMAAAGAVMLGLSFALAGALVLEA